MARPTTALRLKDIDPVAFGAEVARRVSDHVTSLLLQLTPDATWTLPEGGGVLQHEAAMLVTYAQHGLIGDGKDHGDAADALINVSAALFTRAADVDIGAPGPDHLDVDPTDAIGIVLLAAHARIRIAKKEPVPVREIACLAGVEANSVRRLGQSGELSIVDGAVEAKVCRRWLGARGVAIEA